MSIMHLLLLIEALNKGYSRFRAGLLHVTIQTCKHWSIMWFSLLKPFALCNLDLYIEYSQE